MPYLDLPIHRRLFRNGERARLLHSSERNIPGLFASVSNYTTGGPITQYFGAIGIPELAFNPSVTQDLVTPYGAFAAILAEPGVGLAWHHRMISMPKMQGPHGTTESVRVDGAYIAPVVTWDSKITSLLAMCGGIGDLVGKGLKSDGTYARFSDVVTRGPLKVFTHLEGEDVPFALPPTLHAYSQKDFTQCSLN